MHRLLEMLHDTRNHAQPLDFDNEFKRSALQFPSDSLETVLKYVVTFMSVSSLLAPRDVYAALAHLPYNSIGGLVVKLAVAIRDLQIPDIGQPRVRFPADAFLLSSFSSIKLAAQVSFLMTGQQTRVCR